MIYIKNSLLKIIFCVFVIFISINTASFALSPKDDLVYQGIDVSNWQKNIDFSQVKNAGIEIVYIKASEGTTFKDPYLETNYRNAKANNLKVGFYHYLTATSVSAAERQASFFASVIEGKEIDCKLAMDYEEFFGESKSEVNKIAVAFMKKLKQITGKDVVVYSNLNNLKNTFNDSVAREGKLWLAYYSNTQNLNNVNSSWDNYIGLQYTSTGRVPGINGNVDRDRFSKEILIDDLQDVEDKDEENGQYIHNYVVKKGDTLSQIALVYGTTVDEIARLNSIKNVNLIYPGQVLEIITNRKTEASSEKIIYTIKKDDTLWDIAIKYGVTVQNLVLWNNIQNPNLIYTGNQLVIYLNGESNNYIDSKIRYTVKRGDCLWNIAKRYGTTVRQLAYQNKIRNPNLIYPGQILLIN